MRGENLGRAEATALQGAMPDADSSDLEIAAVLTALAQERETADELAGLAEGIPKLKRPPELGWARRPGFRSKVATRRSDPVSQDESPVH